MVMSSRFVPRVKLASKRSSRKMSWMPTFKRRFVIYARDLGLSLLLTPMTWSKDYQKDFSRPCSKVWKRISITNDSTSSFWESMPNTSKHVIVMTNLTTLIVWQLKSWGPRKFTAKIAELTIISMLKVRNYALRNCLLSSEDTSACLSSL